MTMSGQEFRRNKRVTVTIRVPLATVSGNRGRLKDAATIDLSESGARIRFNGQIEPGQVVELFLSKRPEPCRVVWTRPGGARKELIAGLEFICPLPLPRHRQTPPAGKFEPLN